MRPHRLLVLPLIVAASAAAAQQPGPRAPACAQIRDACTQAGFVQGAAKSGEGLVADCIAPIMRGTPQPKRAIKPLPTIDPQLVADCKEQNPRFGQGRQPTSPDAVPTPPPATAPPTGPGAPAPRSEGKRPNIVFILTDDLSLDLVQYMPHVLAMQRQGATFANYFVTDSLCCPSRSSIFTGRYPHSTGIYRNTGPDGGYHGFHERGHEQSTFAVALSGIGYRTAMLGKYLNGYEPPTDPVAPGWTLWAVAGGRGYQEFGYALNQNGTIVRYGNRPQDYLTDVMAGLATDFIKHSAGGPFMIEVATFAPHAPYVPAPRDADAFPGLSAPRTAGFNAAPDPDAPPWLTHLPPLSDADMASIDRDYRRRAQSGLAVDKMIGELQAAVAAIGEADNTYFVFSSDNGYHMGEHRLMPGKMTAFDPDIHVPLIMTGPKIPAGIAIEPIAENVDLYATFAELAGAPVPDNVDGRSLVALLQAHSVSSDWRQVALIEHHGPVRKQLDPDLPAARSGNPPTYGAIRAHKYLYVEYSDGAKEYHDLAADPHELHNTYPMLPPEEKASLHATLAAAQTCHDARSCWTAEAAHPSMTGR